MLATLLAGAQVPAQGSIADCKSMTPCRFPSGYEEFALTFDTDSPGYIDLGVYLWLSPDCVGDPDDGAFFPQEEVPDAGHWNFIMADWIYPKGTDYSIVWTIDDCATTCVNGTTGSTPDLCQ